MRSSAHVAAPTRSLRRDIIVIGAGIGTGVRANGLLYGVDARGEMFWFYPAWTDASRPPNSLHIGTSNEPVRLMEAVRHALVPGRFELHAVFLESPVSAQDAEAGRLPAHETSTLTVEVLP